MTRQTVRLKCRWGRETDSLGEVGAKYANEVQVCSAAEWTDRKTEGKQASNGNISNMLSCSSCLICVVATGMNLFWFWSLLHFLGAWSHRGAGGALAWVFHPKIKTNPPTLQRIHAAVCCHSSSGETALCLAWKCINVKSTRPPPTLYSL